MALDEFLEEVRIHVSCWEVLGTGVGIEWHMIIPEVVVSDKVVYVFALADKQ